MRTRKVAVVMVGLALLAMSLAYWWPSQPDTRPCTHFETGVDGVTRCSNESTISPGVALTLGTQFDLNTATEAQLREVPGLGATVSRSLVEARPDGGFRSWDQVDAVGGLGPARLEMLQRVSSLNYSDAGL